MHPTTTELWSRDLNTSGDYNTSLTNDSDVTSFSFTGATIASPIAMFLTGTIGNILALRVLHLTRTESQRLMFHGLVAGLVWNDLIGILLTSPVTIASYVNNLQMPGGEHLCRFNGFVMICFGLSTPLIVSAMAVERFLFVNFTFFYTKHCTPATARLVMLVIWTFVLFFGLLPMFGFGDYVHQYPGTWCFLDFRTQNPVRAAYGYLYSVVNLCLVLLMLVVNLAVVVTLARVRDYRRKHSVSSLNSCILLGDGVGEDLQRQQQQAQARRRKQRDLELQMIVVMCAITFIFVLCWSPLMIFIIQTLASGGQTNNVFGLVAVRLASVNQTMNPWLYVILRRRLVIRIKRYCCRWRKWIRKKTGSKSSPAHAGRRNQYVHVRNQLCQRSNYVGGDIENQSLIDSLRQSLHIDQPMAMSLPDVMLVNTGRRDLDFSLSGGMKAQSFAGRVSRAYSLGHRDFYRVPSQTENEGQCDLSQPGVDSCGQAGSGQPSNDNKRKVIDGSLSMDDKHDRPAEDSVGRNKGTNKETKSHINDHSDHSFNTDPCVGHNPKENPNPKPNPISHPDTKLTSEPEPKPKLKNKNMRRDFSSVTSASFHGWSRDFRLSQHMHRPRNMSRSSSSKGSTVKGKQMSQAGSGQPKNGGQSSESDEVFDLETDGRGLETGKDMSTSGDILQPSQPTDTAFLSDTAALTPATCPPSPGLHRISFRQHEGKHVPSAQTDNSRGQKSLIPEPSAEKTSTAKGDHSLHLDTQAQVKQKPSVTFSRSLPVEYKPLSVKEDTTSSTRALLVENGDEVISPLTVDPLSPQVDSQDVKVSKGQRSGTEGTEVNRGHSRRHQSFS